MLANMSFNVFLFFSFRDQEKAWRLETSNVFRLFRLGLFRFPLYVVKCVLSHIGLQLMYWPQDPFTAGVDV